MHLELVIIVTEPHEVLFILYKTIYLHSLHMIPIELDVGHLKIYIYIVCNRHGSQGSRCSSRTNVGLQLRS